MILSSIKNSLSMGWAAYGKWGSLFIIALGAMWFIYHAGEKSERNKTIQVTANFKDFRETVDKNNIQADAQFQILNEVYEHELATMENDYEIKLRNTNEQLVNYERDRLRDKDSLRTAENRISSLSEAAEDFTRTNTEGRELSERLEFLEVGILTRLVAPAEIENGKLRVCKKYIGVSRQLKDKYDALRAEHPIIESTN